MTAALEPNPEAARPELTDNGEGGRAPGRAQRRYGTTSLRVGAATIWLSIIVLLPLGGNRVAVRRRRLERVLARGHIAMPLSSRSG